MNYFEEVLGIVNKAEDLGCEQLADGTRLIGRVPHVGPQAFLHEVYPPLAPEGIHEVESALKKPLLQDFADFLALANGGYFFSGALSIHGLRKTYARTVAASRQPFDITTPNIIERPKDARAALLFVGFYNWDGSQLYIDADNSAISRCSRKSAKPLNQWDNFGAALLAEISRLSLLFDHQGREISPDQPTTPP